MKSIERFGAIDRAFLSGEFYFQSLLRQANLRGLLSDDELRRIQLECIELLARQTHRYNGGFSSSIRVEQAQSILESCFYTIGLWLKSLPSADAAVAAVQETAVAELYARGRRLLGKKIKAARLLYMMVLKNKLNTDNHTYNATLAEGIEGFFKIYDADFCAQDIRITADYPLCNPVTGLAGIEFIEKYLTALYYENAFCKRFGANEIHRLLLGFDENYRELVFNIFEQVLSCAIGRRLASQSAAGLDVSQSARARLARFFSGKTEDEILLSLQKAAAALCEELGHKSASAIRYVERSLPQLAARISAAVGIGKPESVFLSAKQPRTGPRLVFSFGEKMGDEAYRALIRELVSCRLWEDKRTLIKRSVHSLADLEEVAIDAELTAPEITQVLRELDIVEIAALFRRHLKDSEFEDLGNDSVGIFRDALGAFVARLPQKERELVRRTADAMED
ncbi:MAG: DUF6179 domain-containing protein [Bacillota bacterium]